MSTYDQIMVENRSPIDVNNEKYSSSKQQIFNKDEDGNGLLGRRVYLESPSFDNKEEEDMYRYVPSRLTDTTATIINSTIPARTDATLMDPFDFDLDTFGTNNNRSQIPYQQQSKPLSNTSFHMPRADPRQDPLLGPLLAELDAMTNQQQQPQQQQKLSAQVPPPSIYRRNSIPYETNLVRPAGLSPPNHADRVLNEALLEAELYDSLNPKAQQQQTLPLSVPSNYSRLSNMNGTDMFVPSSYSTDQASFLSQFGPEDQLFQKPLLNTLGQNYIPNLRQPQQRDTIFDQTHAHISSPQRTTYVLPVLPPIHNNEQPLLPSPPSFNQQNANPFIEYQRAPQRTTYVPPVLPPSHNNEQPLPLPPPSFNQQNSNPFIEYQRAPPQQRYEEESPRPSNNQNLFFTDRTDNQLEQQQQQRQPQYQQQQPQYQQQQQQPQYQQQQQQPQYQQQQQQPQYQQQQQQPQYQQQQPQYQQQQPQYQQQQQQPQYQQQQQPQYQQQQQQPQYQQQQQPQYQQQQQQPQYQQQQQQPQYQQQQQSNMNSQRNSDQQDQDSRRQAHWNELQRNNAKIQDKNVKKHELPARSKAPFGSSLILNSSNSQQSPALSKSPQRPFYQPPPIPKPNHTEDHMDMIKNKENFYHRFPARKYENSYSKPKDFYGGNGNDKYEQESKIQSLNNPQRQTSLPVTIPLNTSENSQTGSLPTTVAIPLDGHVNQVGDKISVNIDLRLDDLQNLKQQQQQQQQQIHPQWAGLDPLDRHIRKLERNIDQSLPIPSPPQRSPVIPSTGTNSSIGRYGKSMTGMSRGGYNPPVYGGGDYYNYNNKGREEDSYLAKMNHIKRNSSYKPYTGRDYEQFKRNYGFGIGHLGYDFDNTTHKEKVDNMNKTKQYAQQIEARNKKKLSDTSRRTFSDIRLPAEKLKSPRPFQYTPSLTRQQQFPGKSSYSSPPVLSKIMPPIPAHRPTEVRNRPPPVPRQLSKLLQHEDSEIIDYETIPVKPTRISSQKQRGQIVDNEKLTQNRTIQRRLSPSKSLPPIRDSKRRPVKFDKLVPDEPTGNHPVQQQSNSEQTTNENKSNSEQTTNENKSNTEQTTNENNKEKIVMDVTRQELSERPLDNSEESVVAEK